VQGIDSLEALKPFKKAALVRKADLLEATTVVLGKVEKMLAERARQLFNRAIVTIWMIRAMFIPYSYRIRSITHVGRGKDTTTMSTTRLRRTMMAPDTACVNSQEELANPKGV
jgi:hypothetical protein